MLDENDYIRRLAILNTSIDGDTFRNRCVKISTLVLVKALYKDSRCLPLSDYEIDYVSKYLMFRGYDEDNYLHHKYGLGELTPEELEQLNKVDRKYNPYHDIEHPEEKTFCLKPRV